MNDALINRIKKLLALASNNSNQAEAEAAMAKAQQMAIQHNIDLAMIGDGQSESKIEIIRDEMEFGQRLPTVSAYVEIILKRFFNVRVIRSGGRIGGRRLIFVGKRDDVDAAKCIYTWLAETMVRCWNCYKRDLSVPLSHKQSYLIGFYTGLANKLESNRLSTEADRLKNDADKNKYALAVVNLQKQIQNFIDNGLGRVGKAVGKRIDVNAGSYARGVSDGNNCSIGNRTAGRLAY